MTTFISCSTSEILNGTCASLSNYSHYSLTKGRLSVGKRNDCLIFTQNMKSDKVNLYLPFLFNEYGPIIFEDIEFENIKHVFEMA